MFQMGSMWRKVTETPDSDIFFLKKFGFWKLPELAWNPFFATDPSSSLLVQIDKESATALRSCEKKIVHGLLPSRNL